MARSIKRTPSKKHEKDKELDIIRHDRAKKGAKPKKITTIKAHKTLRGVRK